VLEVTAFFDGGGKRTEVFPSQYNIGKRWVSSILQKAGQHSVQQWVHSTAKLGATVTLYDSPALRRAASYSSIQHSFA
jgi:hypothetical protein